MNAIFFILTGLSTLITRAAMLVQRPFIPTSEFLQSFNADKVHHYHVAIVMIALAFLLRGSHQRKGTMLKAVASGIILEEHLIIAYDITTRWGWSTPHNYLSIADTTAVTTLGVLLFISGIRRKRKINLQAKAQASLAASE